jgi:hypothetical protein
MEGIRKWHRVVNFNHRRPATSLISQKRIASSEEREASKWLYLCARLPALCDYGHIAFVFERYRVTA